MARMRLAVQSSEAGGGAPWQTMLEEDGFVIFQRELPVSSETTIAPPARKSTPTGQPHTDETLVTKPRQEV